MEDIKPTSAARMKKMREKAKLKDPNFQKEENKRINELKKKKKSNMTNSEREKQRLYERDRKRLQRAKKRCLSSTSSQPSASCTNSPSPPPYRSKQSFSKAMHKTFRALPQSPRKRCAVVQGLMKKVGSSMTNSFANKLSEPEIEDNFKIVKDFFFRPDIVYTCPGIKDKLTIWENGKKTVLTKYYMTMYLREAFAIFKSEHPAFTLGFSKFCSLRPSNVLLLKNMPADQCKCQIHENFKLIIKGLKLTYDNNLWNNLLCDTALNSNCWQNQCNTCNDGKLLTPPTNPAEKIIWKQWEKDQDGRLHLALKEGCSGKLHDLLLRDISKVMHHVNLKRIQADAFQTDTQTPGVRVLQIDFAMSFSCDYQDEIQSALWSRATVTLFTAATFLNGCCNTFLLCTDMQNKDKNLVYPMLSILYDRLYCSDNSSIKEEIIWSDGPTSEFKNKFMAKVLKILSHKYNKSFSWKYFATSHGKGIVDGVGGNAKRLVRQKVMSRSTTVQGAADFVLAAQKIMKKTTVIHISEESVNFILSQNNLWENVDSIPGIQSFHVIKYENEKFSFFKNAMSHPEGSVLSTSSDIAVSLKVGEWIVVNYEGQNYPGEITSTNSDSVEVSVMIKSGSFYKWPQCPDKIQYLFKDVVKKVTAPTIANNRGCFKFTEMF